jgi:hypothetical protein
MRILFQIMSVRQVIDAWQQAAVDFAVGGYAADRDATESNAVIAALAADQHVAMAFAARTMVRKRYLQCGVHRLGSGVCEEYVVKIAGRELCNQIGCAKLPGMAHLKQWRVVQSVELAFDRLDDPGAAMAGVYAPQPGSAIENLASVVGRVVHVACRYENTRRRLELAVCGKRHQSGFRS